MSKRRTTAARVTRIRHDANTLRDRHGARVGYIGTVVTPYGMVAYEASHSETTFWTVRDGIEHRMHEFVRRSGTGAATIAHRWARQLAEASHAE